MKTGLILGLSLLSFPPAFGNPIQPDVRPTPIFGSAAAPIQSFKVESILSYEDNAPDYRNEFHTLIEQVVFYFVMPSRAAIMRAGDHAVACHWGDRPSRPIDTIPNVSFTCNEIRGMQVSGVLDTAHDVMLMHVDVLGKGHVSADAQLQLNQP